MGCGIWKMLSLTAAGILSAAGSAAPAPASAPTTARASAPAPVIPKGNRDANRTEELEKEVLRLRLVLQEKEAELARMRIWLGAAADAGKQLPAETREAMQLRTIEMLSECGIALVLKAWEVSRQLRAFLSPLSPAERAQILLRLEDLETAAQSFNHAAESLNNCQLERCRVLSVNPELGVVALSVGSFAGAAPGMIYRRDGYEVSLISVRPYASAGVVQKGNLRDLIPGMEFSSSEAPHSSVVVFGK